jgi:hypothetical protein
MQEAPTVYSQIRSCDLWAIKSLDCLTQGAVIARALICGTAIAVCDGSYKDQFGTAGFVIQREHHQEGRILGANVTPGHSADQNPYRSEIGGIFAVIVIIEALVQFHDIEHGTIELACDCKSGLTSIFSHQYDTPSQPHHDLIHEIRIRISSSPIEWKFRHVRGHQDKHVSFHLLDMWEQLNVEMDGLAKSFWNEHHLTTPYFYPSNTSGWSLWTGHHKLSNWNRTKLYHHAQSAEILTHRSDRRKIPSQLITSIDWAASKSAIKLLGLNKSLWIPKWIAGFAPVGKVLQRNHLQTHDECPRCSASETTSHVIKCPAPGAVKQWDASIGMPALRVAILQRLMAWKNNKDP